MTDESSAGSQPKTIQSTAATPPFTPLAHPGGGVSPKPGKGKTFDPRSVEKTRPNQLDSVMVLNHPAMGNFSALATNRMANVAIANGLGNERPTTCLISFSEDNQYMFIMPCMPGHDMQVEIKYDGALAALINLWKPFAPMGKSARKGMREYYPVEMTEEPVEIEDQKGFALYVHLVAIKEEPVKSRKKQESK
jgi:hypothetical protein